MCGPFDGSSFNKKKYFITFIDNYSCYGYVYLWHENFQTIDVIKVFINEVERQIDRKVKVIMKLDNTQVFSLNSLRNMAFMLNV